MPLFVATAVTLLILDLAGFGPIIALRRTVLSVGDPVGGVLAFVVSPVSATWNGAVHYDDVEEENHRLRRRVAELEGTIDGRGDLEAELRAVLEATEIEYLGDVERVSARVVLDRRADIERIVEIDKGRDHGIVAGMPVVTGRGLVGMVDLVNGRRSVVRLITDVDTAVGVRSRHGLGLVVGDRNGTLQLEAGPELAESIRLGAVTNGERFVTSGLDRSLFPAGIPIGTLIVQSGPLTADDSGESDGGPGGESGGGPVAEHPPIEAGPLSPAGPTRAPNGSVHDPLDADLSVWPLADIDRLGYLTVLLIEPPT